MSAAHPLLNRRNIVGHSPEFDGVMLQVRNRKSCPGIAVAGLTDRAGIQKIAPARINSQCRKGLCRTGTNLQDFQMGVLIRKAALVMGVTKKRNRRSGVE